MYEDIINVLENHSANSKIDILKITPDDLVEIGEKEGSTNKSNFYFILQEALIDYEEKRDFKSAGYIAHLISFYLHIVFTPINSIELSLKYARKSIKYDSTNIDYKEWILIFSESLNESEIISYLTEVAEKKPESNLANFMMG